MARLISFPFRLNNNGEVTTVEDGTEDYYAEELAVLILTKPGERILVPEFGLTDPAFGNFDEVELEGKIDIFGPPIRLTDITTEFVDATQEAISVAFERQEEDAEAEYDDDYYYEGEDVIDNA